MKMFHNHIASGSSYSSDVLVVPFFPEQKAENYLSKQVATACFLASLNLSGMSVSENKTFVSHDTSVFVNSIEEIDYLKQIFLFQNPKEVQTFLNRHADLMPPLRELQNEIVLRFGFVIANIEVVADIELPGWETLFVKISYSGDFNKAFDKANDLIQNWVFFQSAKFKKLVTISVI